ncbi:IS4 family transposase [Algibacter sp. 2305UL17-15]|uniref:IS4 family transposase n=1 Tax=Algibacter sp. 2305UL17-15 TaxID=3231268 RepID=UPI003457D319
MLEKLKVELFSESLKHKFRVSKNDFTRTRKQQFSCILLFMLNMLRKSLSLEIENFVSFLKLKTHQKFTKSAFVQARMKISPEVFEHLSQTLTNEFYTDNQLGVKLWKGFRLLAVDGSRITLPITKELKQTYGETKNNTKTTLVQARCSVLYDIENNYVLDGTLAPLKKGERELAISHLSNCKKGDLLIYDRGYPSYDFIHQHIERNLDYLIRVKISFSQLIIDFEKSKKRSLIVDIYPGKNTKLSDKTYDKNTPIQLRLIRVELAKGQVEVLMSSLLDSKTYPSSIFKKLYAKRWGVETFYDELKNKLKVEHFSGYSNRSILQDFYAALFISNIQTLIVNEINDEKQNNSKKRKYQYKVNTNLSYGFLKNRVLELFFTEKSMEKVIYELKVLYKENQVPIRPNRSFERNTGKYRTRIKPKITKNQKDSI